MIPGQACGGKILTDFGQNFGQNNFVTDVGRNFGQNMYFHCFVQNINH